MEKDLFARLQQFEVERREKRYQAIGKSYDRALIAYDIVNGMETGLVMPREMTEEMLEKMYGKELSATGKDLYNPYQKLMLVEWQNMGEAWRGEFNEGVGETIVALQGQFSDKERK